MTEDTATMLQRVFGANPVPDKVSKAVSVAEFAFNRLQNRIRPSDIVMVCLAVCDEAEWSMFGKPEQTEKKFLLQTSGPVEPIVTRGNEPTGGGYGKALQVGLKNMEKHQSESPADEVSGQATEPVPVVVHDTVKEPDPRPQSDLPAGPKAVVMPEIDIRRWKDIKRGADVKCDLNGREYDGTYLGISSLKQNTIKVRLREDPRNRKERRVHIKKVALT